MRRTLPQRRFHMSSPTKRPLLRLFIPVLLAFILAFITTKMPLRATLRSLLPTKRATTNTQSSSQIESINKLGLRIFAALSDDNTLISPYSIAAALTLAVEGTEPGSLTHQQFRAILPSSVSLISPGDKSITLRTANAAWMGDVRSEYVEIVKQLGAEVKPLPKQVEDVNAWVSKATNGGIDKLLDTLPQPLIAILVNAVFFKAAWTTKFDKGDTVNRAFRGAGMVKMMTLRKESFPYREVTSDIGRLQVVEIPYGNGEMSGIAVVPGDGVRLQAVVGKLEKGDTEWNKWTEGLVDTKLDELAMPRFMLEYGAVSLKEVLKGLGVTKAWVSDVRDPPFGRMSDDRETFLDEFVHKARLECSEEGTVASAASAAVVMTRSMPLPNPSVVMDRPFLFGVRGRSGELLFIGRVDRPVEP